MMVKVAYSCAHFVCPDNHVGDGYAMKITATIRVVSILTVALLGGCGGGAPDNGAPSSGEDSLSPKRVAALGRIEPASGVVNIGGVPGDRIAELNVAAGDRVQAGDTLAILASHALYEAEVAYAEAVEAEAEKQYAAVEAQANAAIREAELAVEQSGEPLDLELAAQQEQFALLEAALTQAQADLARLEELRRQDEELVGAKALEHARLAVAQARGEWASAQKQLAKFQQTIALTRQQAAAKLDSSKAAKDQMLAAISLKTARTNVERAKRRAEQSVLTAPVAGRVLKVFARPGETLGPQPLVRLADTDRLYVIAEVYESDVHKVMQALDDAGETQILPATISSHALPHDLHGSVDKVLWTVGANELDPLDPTAQASDRVVPVRIEIVPGEVQKHQDLLERLIQLQVNVTIDLTPAASAKSSATAMMRSAGAGHVPPSARGRSEETAR